MENHINMLNTLLLPPEHIQRTAEFDFPNFNNSEKNDDSDSSYDDMLKDYGAVSIPKATGTKIQNTFQGVKSPHIDHIDFMNCQKLINDHKKNTLVYKNQNAVLEKERKLDQLIIKHLADYATNMYSKRFGEESSSSNQQKLISTLLQGTSNESQINEKTKLKILEQLANAQPNNLNSAEGQIAIFKVTTLKNELEDMTLQLQNYESMLTMKDQQIQSLSKLALKSLTDTSINQNNINLEELEKFDKKKLAVEFLKTQKYNTKIDKINTQLQQRLKDQIEVTQILDSKLQSYTANDVPKNMVSIIHPLSQNFSDMQPMINEEVVEAWEILMNTNKELLSELNAYKTFFTSKYDTLERDSSSSYQMLLSLKKETEILNHKIHQVQIENKYLKGCIKEYAKTDKQLVSNNNSNDDSIIDYDPNEINTKFDPNVNALKGQLIESRAKNTDLLSNFYIYKSQNEHLKQRNKQLQFLLDEVLAIQYQLKNNIIELKEKNTKLNVKTSLGPEVLEKLGHKQDTVTSFATAKVVESTADKIKHNMLKGEAEAMNEVIELLSLNKKLEQEIEQKRMNAENAELKLEEVEAELSGLKDAYQELKVSNKNGADNSKKNKDSEISQLLLKIKARDVELNILRSEREDGSFSESNISLKEKLTDARKIIMSHDVTPDLHEVLSKYGDAIPIKLIKNMMLEMHQKYTEHFTKLSSEIIELHQKIKKANDISLKCQYYLKSSMLKCQKLNNTVKKYEEDLKDKRIEEMKILERIVNASMGKYKTEKPTPSPKPKAGQKSNRGGKVKEENKKSAQKEPEDETPNKYKELSKPITIETHAAALQRRVYLLRDENDKLRLDLHNCQQNYLEVKDQFWSVMHLNEFIPALTLTTAKIEKKTGIDTRLKEIMNQITQAETGNVVSVLQYESNIADKYINSSRSDDQLLTSIGHIWDKARAQIEHCKLKCSIQDLIRLLIIANPTLQQEEVNTEKERRLQSKIEELENSNKSLRQNLLDTINELKTTEKENEKIFSDKLKLLRQLGKNYEDTQNSEADQLPSKQAQEAEDEDEIDNQRGSATQDELNADNLLFKQNDALLDRSDNMINKYNSVIKSNLEKTNINGEGDTSLRMATDRSNLPKINETTFEDDYHSDPEGHKLPKKSSKKTKPSLEEEKNSMQPISNFSRPSVKPDANINKVIGIIEDLEKDLKQSFVPGKNQFFDKRNKSSLAINKKKKGDKLLPDPRGTAGMSFENDTISVSSRVQEKTEKMKEVDDDGAKPRTPFRIKKKSKKGDRSNLPPMYKK